MKKLLTVTAVLMAAALIFTGCKNAANSDDGGEDLPGTWTSDAEVFEKYKDHPGRKITVTDKTVTFTCTPSEVESSDVPSQGFYSYPYSFTTESIYTGFKVSASGSSSKSGCGLLFCGQDVGDNSWSGYKLLLDYDGFMLEQIDEGKYSDITTNWVTNSAIKKEPAANDVTIYTDSDSNIVIKINGTKVYTLKNPTYKKGWIGFTANIAKDDVTAGKTVTQKYVFKEFQTAK